MQTRSNAGFPDRAAELAVDPDEAPILTEADVKDVELFHGDTFIKRGRGRPSTGNAKELVSVRLSRDVVARLREAGPGWQSQVDTLLRGALGLLGTTAQEPGLRTMDRVSRVMQEIDAEIGPVAKHVKQPPKVV